MPGAVKVSARFAASSGNHRAQPTPPSRPPTTSSSPPAISASRKAQADSRVAATVAKDLEATRAERCKQARDDYNTSINSRRLYTDDKDGKRTYLSDVAARSQRLEAAKAVESICGPQG